MKFLGKYHLASPTKMPIGMYTFFIKTYAVPKQDGVILACSDISE